MCVYILYVHTYACPKFLGGALWFTMFDFRHYVMKIVLESPNLHQVRLREKLKSTAKCRSTYSKVFVPFFNTPMY